MKYLGGSPISRLWQSLSIGALILGSGNGVSAITLDISSTSSIKQAAWTTAHGMMSYYQGNLTGGTPGLLPDGYYWWECGAMFGQLISYWYYTGDTTYNENVLDGMMFQTGPDNDFMPQNQTTTEGNDDQVFWAFAAMSAAENKFPDPPSGKPSWLALAQAVFNEQVSRWDTAACNGGLRWQIYSFNSGYNYKQTVSNGGLFALGARLARYTGNTTYSDWAEKVWDWMAASPLLTADLLLYDGTSTTVNCSTPDTLLWTYNQGVFISGAAFMYNYTNGSAIWEQRLTGLLNSSSAYLKGNVMSEVTCEPTLNCNTDEVTFKGFFAQWLAQTTQLASFTTDTIMPILQASAEAAAKSCSGGSDGVTCGMTWLTGSWDGKYGVGEQMSAMSVFQANLIGGVTGPVTSTTGGTSKGDASAGTGSSATKDPYVLGNITTGDRAGAGILTVLVLVGVIGGTLWLIAGPG